MSRTLKNGGPAFPQPLVYTSTGSGIVSADEVDAGGDSITTSEIKSIKSDADAVTAISGNGTEYVLGAVDPAYEKAYPNALRRLIATFNQRLPA